MDRTASQMVSLVIVVLFLALCPRTGQVLASSSAVAGEKLTIPSASPQVRQTTLTFAASTDILVQDSSFEAGTPNPYWAETSTNFGTPLCTVAACGTGTGTGPHTGAWWAWFGGISIGETGTLEQTGIIPRGASATLSFFLEIPAAMTPGFLKVLLDGNLLFEATDADAAQYAVYAPVTLDIRKYADGKAHALRFESTIDPGNNTNFFVDDVVLVVEKFSWPLFLPAFVNSHNNKP